MTLLDCVPALLAGAATFFAVRARQWRARARETDAVATWALRDRDRIIRAARPGDDLVPATAGSFAAMLSRRGLQRAGADLARRDYRAFAVALGEGRSDPGCPAGRLDPCQSAALVLLLGEAGRRDDLVARIVRDVRGRR
ncbi:MAG: hypothetical protein VYD87_11000 [Pseudomonadota bacterium]|nr:hypothetical protein [Pseudomonadota bacterium]